MRNARERILLVDDSADALDVIGRNLAAHGYGVATAPTALAALDLLARNPVDLLVTDLRMPGMSGLELMQRVRASWPDMEVMMITGYATIESAVAAVKSGAEEYLAKPFTDEELLAAVERALAKLRARREARPAAGRLGLVGASETWSRAVAVLERVARTGGPVLVVGEEGTGRAAAGRAVATARGASSRLVLAVECGALSGSGAPPEPLQVPPGGTLVLRGLEWADLRAQERLLGLVRSYVPSGVQLVFTAGPELPVLQARGLVNAELHDLLAANAVTLPPLRERGDDVVLLAEHFTTELAARTAAPAARVAASAREALLAYAWPGNVAELRAAVLSASCRAMGETLELKDWPGPVRAASPHAPFPTLAALEAEHLQTGVARAGGNKSRAADLLGIDRKTLREKLKALGRDRGDD